MTDTPKTHPAIDTVADLLKKASDRVRGMTLSESDKSILDEAVKDAKGFFDSVRVVPDKKEESSAPEDLGGHGRVVFLNEKSRRYQYADRDILVAGPYHFQVQPSGGHILRDKHGVTTYVNAGWLSVRSIPNA